MRTWIPDAAERFDDNEILSAYVEGQVRSTSSSAMRCDGKHRKALRHPKLFYALMQQRNRADDLEAAVNQSLESMLIAQTAAETLTLPVELCGPDDHISNSLSAARSEILSVDPNVSIDALFAVKPADLHVERVRRAATLLRDAWPEMHDEIADNVQQLAVFRGRGILGFTNFGTHGAIYIQERYAFPELTRDEEDGWSVADLTLAESIVHEGTHTRLNAASFAAPYLRSDAGNECIDSPLRADPRPINGVFQQLFVLTRLAALNERASRFDQLETETKQRADSNRDDARAALRAVQNNVAALTDVGYELIDVVAADLSESAA